MGFLKDIRNLLILVIIVGVSTAFIDYTRMMGGQSPIFNISKYNGKTKVQSYRGLFYQASRKVRVSTNESLVDSSDIEYTVLNQKINVPRQFKKQGRDLYIETKTTPNCSGASVLYYANTSIKVYTYCLDSISVMENNKTKSLLDYLKTDKKIIDNIDYRLSYTGMYSDNSTLMFTDMHNFSNNGLTMFRCNKENVNDIYFAPKDTSMQTDFCTYKDDDFKFISEVKVDKDIPSTTDQKIIYEDDKYTYELEDVTIDQVSLVAPAVRGKGEVKLSLSDVLQNNILTIDELIDKGLNVKKIPKS